MSDVAVEPKVEGFARTFLLDRLTVCLLKADEPLKVGEILAAVQYEGTFTARLVRAVLESSERFRFADRRWTLAPLEIETHRPLEACMEQIMQQVGLPLTAVQIAWLLSESLERDPSVLLPAVRQVLGKLDKYFAVGDRWGLTTWLLDLDSHNAEEIIFRNFFFDEEELTRFQAEYGALPWNAANLLGSALSVLHKAAVPVPNKVLQFFAWQTAQRKFRPLRFFTDLLGQEELVLLSTGHWCAPEVVHGFAQTLQAFGEQLSEQEVPEEEEVQIRVEAIQVGEQEIHSIFSMLEDQKSHRISELIDSLFELSPGDAEYNMAFGNVWGAMGADERFAWVGGERWRLANTVPATLNKIPELLELPYLPYFVNDDGEPIDVELEEAGFEGDLAECVKDPRVMIAGQPAPEGTVPAEAPVQAPAAVRYEHRLAGTLPVYGELRALFPTQPEIVELTFFNGSKSATGWLNNAQNLALELGAYYDRLDLPLCGGAFTLQPRGREGTTDYTVTYNPGDVDALVALSDERLAELEALREAPESAETSTFDLLCKLMAGRKKGVHFITLFTEVNVIRRTHAYLIASLLSAYACFSYLRPGTWGFEEKKVDQGIRKQKRKFIKE